MLALGRVMSGEAMRGRSTAERSRGGVMHVRDEELMQLGRRVEPGACVPRSDECPFDDLRAQCGRLGPELGPGLRREHRILRNERIVERCFVGEWRAKRERKRRVAVALWNGCGHGSLSVVREGSTGSLASVLLVR
jgi:hypothetical protein